MNLLDVGASDGIAAKFFLKNLNINKIYCYEPHKEYCDKIKKINTKKIIIRKYAIGNVNKNIYVYYPQYNFFSKKLNLITYTYYNKKLLLKQIFLDFYFKKKIKVIKKKLKINKFKIMKKKIDLIKIDVNGYELSVIQSMLNLIKRDLPTLLIETSKDINIIFKILKKLNYKKFKFDNKTKKFIPIKNNNFSLNTYFINSQ